MKTVKRILSLCLVLALCLCLAACGKKKQEEAETTTVINTATITFPEGIRITEAAKLLEENGVCSAADFEAACNTIPEGYEDLLDGASVDGKVFALEGYIFPDTYEFYLNDSAENVLKRFLDNLNSKLTSDDYERMEELGYTTEQLLTLASIIQAEASDPNEMPAVAGVFYNRLNSVNFPYLGSDVTRHYIERYMKDYIEENGLDYDTLFANYCTNDGYSLKTQGLPAGPICNPGYDAIQAALYPEESNYYYFFTDQDNNYHYNETLAGHNSEWASIQS